MNIAEVSIQKKTITLVLTVLLLVGGMQAFNDMGRLEDPEFTIKEAVITTPYPGASPEEVSEEVTEIIEKACQQLGQLKDLRSWSFRGLSLVKPEIKEKYDKYSLPQVWDELRSKVGDVQEQLPPGAGPSLVNDDFGDVYGIFFALTGDDYTYAELKDYADFLQRELLLVQDVKKVDLYGVQNEVVYIEMSREKIARFGITQDEIYSALREKNLVADAGRVETGTDYIPIHPTGEFRSEQQFGDLLIAESGSDKLVYLKDVATIRRDYQEPPKTLLRFDGKPAIGIGISTVFGGNVVVMGEELKKKLKELEPFRPAGMELNIIAYQADAVTTAIDGFIVSLLQAVAIVIVVLLIFMGLRSGLIIGFILVLTIIGSFVFLRMQGVMLERISLGALIIALGMLVDNAIVITEGMLIKIEQGEDRIKAARDVAGQTMMPLLGATLIAIFAFGPIGLSQDSTGEYCRSLFQVLSVSLLFSWVTAITVTPLMCYIFIKPKPSKGGADDDPYKGVLYQKYKALLQVAIKNRWITIAIVACLFMCAIFGFRFIENSFFPNSTRPQFMIEIWTPEGTHIRDTEKTIAQVEEYIKKRPGVTHVASCVGQGALRFLLTYAPEPADTSYGILFVEVDDYRKIDAMKIEVQQELEALLPNATVGLKKFILGPGEGGKIQARWIGSDPTVLRRLEGETIKIMSEDGEAQAIRSDWREKVKVVRPVMAETQSRQAGIERPDLANALKTSFEGSPIGVYREARKLIPIVSKSPEEERVDIRNMQDLQIHSPAADGMIPMRQIVSEFTTYFEDAIIGRRNRRPTVTIHCDRREGNASILLGRLMPKIESLERPQGYIIDWGGEYESSRDGQAGIKASLPLFFTLMVLITIFLFNSLRHPLIIWLTVPLAIIGVAAGLIATGQPMGFMTILGVLSLSGMLIKNAIVLIDEINQQIAGGKKPYTAILDASVSRIRPVSMAAVTTVLGMIPLLGDAFFVAMAVAIMAGLTFATGLTLIVVPVLFAILFRVQCNA